MPSARSSFLILASIFGAGGIFAAACGGISDPTLSPSEDVGSVQGALSGAGAPPDSHVALVYWAPSSGLVVYGDAPIVDGKFTLKLRVPRPEYFVDADGIDLNAGTGSQSHTNSVRTLGTAEGAITSGLTTAISGFVVYVDGNGNGNLDIAPDTSTPDSVLGGNNELMLTFLRGGGELDYEKLRDRSGIRPERGFNLAWLKDRWVGLNLVELKIQAGTQLPSAVCQHAGSFGDGGASSQSSLCGIAFPRQDGGGGTQSDGGAYGDGGPLDHGGDSGGGDGGLDNNGGGTWGDGGLDNNNNGGGDGGGTWGDGGFYPDSGSLDDGGGAWGDGGFYPDGGSR